MALRRSRVRIPLGPHKFRTLVPKTRVYITTRAGVLGYLPASWGHRVKTPTAVFAERHTKPNSPVVPDRDQGKVALVKPSL